MSHTPYPSTWPKANGNPHKLVSRITEQQKLDLYNRRVTTRALALTLNVREAYLSSLFPGKVSTTERPRRTGRDKSALLAARRGFRREVAGRVLKQEFSIKAAAEFANTSYRTMARVVKALRGSNNG